MSSIDLLHWRHHPDALTVKDGDLGCFSGGAFLDSDKTAYLTFWKFPAADGSDKGGAALAKARPPYDHWTRIEPLAVESGADWGVTELSDGTHISSADPFNIWKADGWYYMLSGNKPVLDVHGREETSDPRYKGDWLDLFRSQDLKKWDYVHRFYDNPRPAETWPDETEDNMCPTFLPLYDAPDQGSFTGKWLLSFISHNKGTQYYIGSLENETFLPESHGRMSWVDKGFFAPEAMTDDRNRHILWAWLLGLHETEFRDFGWSGVFSLPRCLWLEDGTLRMAPVEELERLQYNHQSFPPALCRNDLFLPVKNGRSFRMKAVIDMSRCELAGFRVLANSDGDEYTDIYFDKAGSFLAMDTTNSGKWGWKALEQAPFTLEENEKLRLDIFVDNSVVEVFANDRQAIARRVFPTHTWDALGVHMIGVNAQLDSLDVWEMMPSNPY